MRGKAIKKRKPGRRLVKPLMLLVAAGVVVAAAVFGASWAWARAGSLVSSVPVFTVKEVSVSGLNHVRREDFLRYIGDPTGKSVFSASPRAMLDTAKTHPWVKDVSVKRELPSSFRFEVTERVPAALVLVGDSKVLVDTDGFAIAKVDGRGWETLPVIEWRRTGGLKLMDASTTGAVRSALDLLRLLAGDVKERFTGARVVVPEDGGGAMLHEGATVRFGVGGLDEKFRRLCEVVDDIRRRQAHPTLIDLRFPGKVVVRGADAASEG